MAEEMRVIGSSPPRIDGVEKVTGAAMYSGDIKPDKMAYGKIIGSPFAHAKILSIDSAAAEAVPGVLGVATGKDVPDTRTGGYVRDRHIICREYVRYVGDYVAVVIATSEDVAAIAAKLVKVEYEELPAVFTPDDAYRKDPPAIVHPNLPDYMPTGFQGIEEFGQDPERPNLFVSSITVYGDVENGFQECDVIVENSYKLPFVSHCTLETHQCVAIPDPDGGLTIYASDQTGSTAKYDIAKDLEMDSSKIRMHIPYLGGGFGGKTGISISCVAAVAAMKVGRPVRIVQSREESFTSGGPRGSASLWIKDGYKKDGTLHARHITLIANGGAYSSHALIMVLCVNFGAIGNYRVPNLLVECRGVYTNTAPTWPYRALGSEFMVFAIERNMEIAAKYLSMDRGQLRLKNLIIDGDIDGLGKRAYNNGSVETLRRTLDKIKLNEKRAPEGPWHYGKSVAIGNKFIGTEDPMGTGALCKIQDDGTAVIYISHVELGQGGLTVDAMAAAETLKLPYDKIKVVFGDSEICPHDQGTFCSRGTFVNGNAVIEACEDAKKQMFSIASRVLNVPAEALDTEDGKIFEKENPGNSIPYAGLFDGDGSVFSGALILGRATWHHPDAFASWDDVEANMTYSIGAWGIEVAVNIETGEVRLEKLEGCYDCGHVINQKTCEGQIEGAFSMGFAQAVYEEIVFNDKGKVINGNFRDYKIPTFMDGPRNGSLNFSFIENPNKHGPYGAKGIGEVAMIPIMPAMANAISDAIGVEINELPLSRERVWRTIKKCSDYKK